jgi:gluconolactonase
MQCTYALSYWTESAQTQWRGLFPQDAGACRSAWVAGLVGLLLVAGLDPERAAAQASPVPADARVEQVAGGFEFTEGPVWYEGRLLFSDIPANTVYTWQEGGEARVFLEPSGRANGLAVDNQGRLLLAQHDGQVGRLTAEGDVQSLVSTYDGKRLNSPNDLDVAAGGAIYFTDPPYGVSEAERALDFSGVYRLAPDGALMLLHDAMPRPNGIVLSPDGATLYVSDSQETIVQAFDVAADGSITNGRRFATPQADAEGTTDGMAIDADGHLYTTGPGGVWVYAPDGTLLDRIAVPESATNVAFGGPDGSTLYITAPPNVYRVPVEVPGAE